jgi:succinate dehydrogenase/fumarate reductase-like Fe-S protein
MFLCTPQVVGKPDIGIEFTDRQLPSTTDNYRQQADNYRQQAHNYRQQADNYRQQAEKYRQQANTYFHCILIVICMNACLFLSR